MKPEQRLPEQWDVSMVETKFSLYMTAVKPLHVQLHKSKMGVLYRVFKD